MKKCPCHKCEKRVATKEYNCHSDCPDYAEYLADRIKYHVYNNGNNPDYMMYREKMVLKRIKKRNEKIRN